MYTCKICGKSFEGSHFSHMNICSDVCFQKDFWLQIIEEKEKHPIIDGVCYYLDMNNLVGARGMQGFSGRRLRIRFFADGKIIETTNLWHNGTVPEEFRDRLPDTAEFIPTVSSSKGELF